MENTAISFFSDRKENHKGLDRDVKVLVVDDADDLRKTYAQGLTLLGYEVRQARSGLEALERVRAESADAVVLDLNMPGMDGLSCLKALKEVQPDIEAIIITGYGTIPSAVEAMRLGAYDYIAKPFSFDELDQRLKRCMQAHDLRRENIHLRGVLREKYHCENLIGKSEAIRRVFRMIRQVAQSRSTVLLLGKSGTGKELVARAIHFNSSVAAGPMITVDCGAIAPTVIESELFGHVKGAFTGAMAPKEGLFRLARGGTLFFDEIGELPMELQTKLLRALQEREIRPVGSDRTVSIDVRVIAATHRNLQNKVKEGLFREDLFYRLNVITIEVPSLSEHKDDIPLLVAHFMKKHSRPERPMERVSGEAMQALVAYEWPGNVRELENVVERALALGHGPSISAHDLPPHIAGLGGHTTEAAQAERPASGAEIQLQDMVLTSVASEELALINSAPLAPPPGPGGEISGAASSGALPGGQNTLDEIERQAILATLRVTNGDRTACARILGIDKSTLYRKLKRYHFVVGDGEE